MPPIWHPNSYVTIQHTQELSPRFPLRPRFLQAALRAVDAL